MNSQQLPQGEEKVRAVRSMFDSIAPRYDLVNRIMTFRLDVRWRRRAVAELGLPAASRVIDLASGTGDLCLDLRRADLHPLSFDLSFGMLAADRSSAPRTQADVLRLPLADASVDGATCGFALRNLLDLPTFFGELARVVRPGGRIALLDVGVPRNPSVIVVAGDASLASSRRGTRGAPTAACAWSRSVSPRPRSGRRSASPGGSALT